MFAAQQHSTRSGIASSSSLFNRGSSRANNNKKNKTTTMRKTMRICPMASIPQQGGNAQPREFLLSCIFFLNYFRV
jgi:hypothetical protein